MANEKATVEVTPAMLPILEHYLELIEESWGCTDPEDIARRAEEADIVWAGPYVLPSLSGLTLTVGSFHPAEDLGLYAMDWGEHVEGWYIEELEAGGFSYDQAKQKARRSKRVRVAYDAGECLAGLIFKSLGIRENTWEENQIQ